MKEQVPKKDAPPLNPRQSDLPSAEDTLALIKSRRSVFPKDYNGQKLSKPQVGGLACRESGLPVYILLLSCFLLLEAEQTAGVSILAFCTILLLFVSLLFFSHFSFSPCFTCMPELPIQRGSCHLARIGQNCM
jgi:hypothetical protein